METESKYYMHFLKGNKRPEERIRRIRKNEKKLNNNFDKLFFNFIAFFIPERLTHSYDKVQERTFKYEFSHKMENIKFKNIDAVINNLCYEDNINLNTLSALSVLFHKKIFFYSDNVLCDLNQNYSHDTCCHIVDYTKSIYTISHGKLTDLKEQSYIIPNVIKPIYGVSRYKLLELQDILSVLNLTVEKKNKKNIYDKIVSYLDMILY